MVGLGEAGPKETNARHGRVIMDPIHDMARQEAGGVQLREIRFLSSKGDEFITRHPALARGLAATGLSPGCVGGASHGSVQESGT